MPIKTNSAGRSEPQNAGSEFDDVLALFTEQKALQSDTYQRSIDDLCKALLQLDPAES